jgi:hypothetical protein
MPAKGDPLPNADHVLRYIRRKHVDRHDGKEDVTGSGFLARPGEGTPSVNWMECFPAPVENQVREIRAEKRITYEKKSKLVRLNVGQAIAHLAPEVAIAFLYDPEDATHAHRAHTSHAIIQGVPDENDPKGEAIGDMLLACVIGTYDPIAG